MLKRSLGLCSTQLKVAISLTLVSTGALRYPRMPAVPQGECGPLNFLACKGTFQLNFEQSREFVTSALGADIHSTLIRFFNVCSIHFDGRTYLRICLFLRAP